MRLRNLIITTAILSAFTPSAYAHECKTLGPCVALGNIAVLAEIEIADPILNTAQNGAASFMRYFGAQNAQIAIVPGGEITSELQNRLDQAGYSLSLPWISAADKQALAVSNIRRQVMKQTKGLPAAQQETIMDMALEKAAMPETSSGAMDATEKGALTHELGHLWFMSAFKPAGGETGGGHGYGGWAPDWLDETAAILLENETLTESRRKAFRLMDADDFYPLKTFLTMEHPALKSANALKEKFAHKNGAGGSRAIVLSGKDAEAFLAASGQSDPANFYTQARGFADFVIELTGDEQIFAKLAQHLSKGESFESWLARSKKLPPDLPSLTAKWEAHLASR